jgi:hypothetical protein
MSSVSSSEDEHRRCEGYSSLDWSLLIRNPDSNLPVPSKYAQTLVFKAALEHFDEFPQFAALGACSSAFRNSSLAANLLSTKQVNCRLARLILIVFPPSACFSTQFTFSLHLFGVLCDKFCKRLVDELLSNDDSVKYFKKSLQSIGFSDCPTIAKTILLSSAMAHPTQQPTLITSEFANLVAIDLGLSNGVSDEFLLCLPQFPTVEVLKLGFADISVLGIEVVAAKFPRLTQLCLNSISHLNDEGLAPLAVFSKQLAALRLWSCGASIGDKSMKVISNFKKLTSLSLYASWELTSAGMEEIAHFENLTSLDLFSCDKIDSRGWRLLKNFVLLTDLMCLLKRANNRRRFRRRRRWPSSASPIKHLQLPENFGRRARQSSSELG